MRYPDAELLARFDAASLPEPAWSHECHLRVAYLALREQPYPQAIRRLRDGIRRLNRAHGLVEGEERGYHETLTLAWARLVAAALTGEGPGVDSEAFLRAHPELLCRERVLDHYTPERLRSPRARREFVLPDRAPLPALRLPLVGNRSGPRKDPTARLADPAPRLRGSGIDGSGPSRRTRT